MELVDLFAEGSVNLVIADFGNILLMPKLQAKLKVFKGEQIRFLLSESSHVHCFSRIFVTQRKQSDGSAMCSRRLLHG